MKTKPKVTPFAEIAAARGPNILYRKGETNRCPYCGGTQWLLGRGGAECAYANCSMLMEYDNPPTSGVGMIYHRNLHVPEKRPTIRGGELIRAQDFHIPERREVA